MFNAIVPATSQQLDDMSKYLEIQRQMLGFEKDMATVMLGSGLMPKGITTVQQFMAITSYGRMLGIEMWAALKHIHVINNSPEPDSQLKLALVRRSGQLETIKIECDGQVARVTMKRFGQDAMTTEYTIDEARKAKLTDKDIWQKYPADMLVWRAVGRACKRIFPDVLNGLAPVPQGATLAVVEGTENPYVNSQQRLDAKTALGAGENRRIGGTPKAEQIVVSKPEAPKEEPGYTTITRPVGDGTHTETLYIPNSPAPQPPPEKLTAEQVLEDDTNIDRVAAEDAAAGVKGYKLDSKLHRSNFLSWCYKESGLGLKMEAVARIFGVDALDLDEELATYTRAEAETLVLNTQPTPAGK